MQQSDSWLFMYWLLDSMQTFLIAFSIFQVILTYEAKK